MSRRYADPIEVRHEIRQGLSTPASFLWRDRLYVVRAVIGHWWERRAWWAMPAARAVHGENVGQGGALADRETAVDREIWRVEAGRGRAFGTGVYDLCTVTPAAGQGSGWRLIRVVD